MSDNPTIQTIQNDESTYPKSREATIISSTSNTKSTSKMTIFKWFLEPQFYLVACVYVTSKFFVSMSVSYIPLYMQHSLKMESVYVASVPLVMYVTGFIVSIVLKYLTDRYGFKLAFAISCLIGISK